MRTSPNILICGTPGTGKSSTAEMLASTTLMTHLNIGSIVKEQGFHDGYNKEFDTYYINEDLINDHLEIALVHERWFDLVIVLQTDNTMLYPRLLSRNYSQLKISENISCQVFNVVKEQALESYDPEIVVCLPSDNVDDMESNIERIVDWIDNWRKENNTA